MALTSSSLISALGILGLQGTSPRLAPSERQLAVEAQTTGAQTQDYQPPVVWWAGIPSLDSSTRYGEASSEYLHPTDEACEHGPSDLYSVIPSLYKHDVGTHELFDSWDSSLDPMISTSLLNAIRGNKSALERRVAFFAEQHMQLMNELNMHQVVLQDLVNMQTHVYHRHRAAKHAANVDSRKVALLHATSKRLVQNLCDIEPIVTHALNQYNKIDEKLLEFRRLLEDEDEKEQRFVVELGMEQRGREAGEVLGGLEKFSPATPLSKTFLFCAASRMPSMSYPSNSAQGRSSSSATSCRLPFLRPSARQIFDEVRATKKKKNTRKASPAPQSSDADDLMDSHSDSDGHNADSTDEEDSLACDKTIIETVPYRHDVSTESILPSSFKAHIKQVVPLSLLDAIRANGTTNESIYHFLAAEQDLLEREISTIQTESNKIIEIHASVGDKLVQVLSNKKKRKDYLRGTLLLATQNRLADMNNGVIPGYKARARQLDKIEDRIEEVEKVIFEEQNKETKLMQVLNQTTEPEAESSSSESAGSEDSWEVDEEIFVMEL